MSGFWYLLGGMAVGYVTRTLGERYDTDIPFYVMVGVVVVWGGILWVRA